MAINELQDFRLIDLHEKLRIDEDKDKQLQEEEFENWLVSMGLLHGSMLCNCGSQMKLVRDHHGTKIWRCSRRVHGSAQRVVGFMVGTFFEDAHISIKDIFKLSYFWAMRQPLEYAQFETQISHRQVVFWYKRFRRICSQYFRDNPVQLGGPNLTVCSFSD
jgi:hypothetical protein